MRLSFAQYEMPDSEFKVTRQGWVQYGDDNDFPDYLYELYKGSATHHALCNGIADMAFSRGVEVVSDNLELRATIQSVINKSGPLARKALRDLKIYGRCYLDVIEKVGGGLSSVEHIPFRNVRAGEMIKGEIKSWWTSLDWKQIRRNEFKPTEWPSYKAGVRHGIFSISIFGQDDQYYPNPDYIGALSYVALEKLVAEFHLNNLENGLFPSFHIHHNNGVPNAEERLNIRKEYEDKMAGTGNAGAFILTFSDGTERKTELTPIQLSDSDKQYTFLSEEATKKIMIGHRVTSPLLFGIRDSAGLGSNKDEMTTAMELMTKNVLQGYRDVLCEGLETLFGARFKVREEETEQKMSITITDQRPVLPEEAQAEVLEYLGTIAESRADIEEDYRLIDEEFFDEEPLDDRHYSMRYAFAIAANPEEKSTLDRGFYLVRYSYVVGSGPDLIDTSRGFCRTMINQFSASVFRKEDISMMSFSRANPDFGTYSIWKFKGSYGCRHRWKRMVYFLKRVPKGQSITISGVTYKPGQFLPTGVFEHYKLLPGTDVPGKEVADAEATKVNDKPKR